MKAKRAMDLARSAGRRARRNGWADTLRTAARRGSERAGALLGWDEPALPLNGQDVFTGAAVQTVPGRSVDRMHVGIVCFPPAAGSGGHTTLFRMVRGLEVRGHRCTLVLYDPAGGEVSWHETTIRRAWPDLQAGIASADAGFGGYDAVVASSWETAHVVATRNREAVPFYFIQDYEPFFYAHGYQYELAQSTYALGLKNIALGGMVATELRRQIGVEPDLEVPFGCDTDTYRLLDGAGDAPGLRRGVVYYAKRTVDRRGYLLAKAALERFHALRPDQPIHIVGDTVRGWNTPAIQHGSVPPAELNRIYNGAIAGLAMSFTNVSLVPGELLASGTVPVLNRLAGPRLDLNSPDAVWTSGHPEALARALAEIVDADDLTVAERARRVAEQPRPTWAAAQTEFADFLEETVRQGTGRQGTGRVAVTGAPAGSFRASGNPVKELR